MLKPVYGLTKDIHTFNLFKIGFHEIAAIAADVRRAPTLRANIGQDQAARAFLDHTDHIAELLGPRAAEALRGLATR